MRKEQAEMLIDKLEAAYNQRLPGSTRALYTDKLMTLPVATGVKRVDTLINTSKFMPKIAELMRPTDSEVAQINTTLHKPMPDTPETLYTLYRSDKLPRLSEQEYWDYLHDPRARAKIESEWKHEFAHRNGEAST